MRIILSAVICLSLIVSTCAMPICGSGRRANCVYDGDTVWVGREKIRLLDIDTPEMGPPRCSGPAPLATRARDRLAALLNGKIDILRDGTDVYDRTLAHLEVDGVDVGSILLSEGLARPYVPGQEPWC